MDKDCELGVYPCECEDCLVGRQRRYRQKMKTEIIKCEEERLSVCCEYPIYDDSDICSKCKEHTAEMED